MDFFLGVQLHFTIDHIKSIDIDFILSVRLFLYTRFFMWIYKASKLLDSQRLKNNWANKSHDN